MVKPSRKAGRQVRITALPDSEVVRLRHHSCDFPLTLLDALVGGVRCGTAFEYRARTRKLRRTA